MTLKYIGCIICKKEDNAKNLINLHFDQENIIKHLVHPKCTEYSGKNTNPTCPLCMKAPFTIIARKNQKIDINRLYEYYKGNFELLHRFKLEISEIYCLLLVAASEWDYPYLIPEGFVYNYRMDCLNVDWWLRRAAGSGRLDTVDYLVKIGADIHTDIGTILGISPFNWNFEMLKYLVDLGADIHADDEKALRFCALNGHYNIVQFLVQLGADIHADNERALISSASNGHFEIVKYLAERGADIHADNEHALISSASNGHFEIVKYLVELGADIHAENEFALKWSVNNEHYEIVNYLIEKGADINAIPTDDLRKMIADGCIKIKKEPGQKK